MLPRSSKKQTNKKQQPDLIPGDFALNWTPSLCTRILPPHLRGPTEEHSKEHSTSYQVTRTGALKPVGSDDVFATIWLLYLSGKPTIFRCYVSLPECKWFIHWFFARDSICKSPHFPRVADLIGLWSWPQLVQNENLLRCRLPCWKSSMRIEMTKTELN